MTGSGIGRDRIRTVGYALAVVIVALAVLSLVSDAPLVDLAFDAVLPFIYLFFASQAVGVRGSISNPFALLTALALTVGALTEWYVLAVGGEGPLATAGRVVSVAGLVAYVILLVRTSESRAPEEPIDDDWAE